MKGIFKLIVQSYLKFLTKIVIARHQPLIIAVAGTTNKTFVKEVILDELGRNASARGNPTSFNTEIGLPLAVLYLPSGLSSISKWLRILLTGTGIALFSQKFPKTLVLEMGVDRQGDMTYLLSLIKPKIAIITTVRGDFSETGATLDDIATELSFLVKAIPADGLVLLNAEDSRVKNLGTNSQAKVVLYGEEENCQAKIFDIEPFQDGQKFSLEYAGEIWRLETPKHGQHNISAMAIAKIVAKELSKIQK